MPTRPATPTTQIRRAAGAAVLLDRVHDEAPTTNDGAGRTYPLKWQLLDASGNYVSTLSTVTKVQVESATCGTFDGDSTLDTATTTGGTTLRYDSTANQFVYNWATPGSGCYTVVVTLAGGQVLTANFNLS
jgi:hypothetical protein